MITLSSALGGSICLGQKPWHSWAAWTQQQKQDARQLIKFISHAWEIGQAGLVKGSVSAGAHGMLAARLLGAPGCEASAYQGLVTHDGSLGLVAC